MKILVQAFHPNLTKSRINKRWVEELQKHPEITLRLHYDLHPNWQFDVAEEQALLLAHERIVFQHPFYWYSCPPLMKKWLDDVLTFGWAYGPGGTQLNGKEWVSAISTGGPAHSYQAGGYNNFAISELLKPLQQTANLTGMAYLPAFTMQGVIQASDEALEQAAKDYVAHITNEQLNPKARLKKLLGEIEEKGTKLSASA